MSHVNSYRKLSPNISRGDAGDAEKNTKFYVKIFANNDILEVIFAIFQIKALRLLRLCVLEFDDIPIKGDFFSNQF